MFELFVDVISVFTVIFSLFALGLCVLIIAKRDSFVEDRRKVADEVRSTDEGVAKIRAAMMAGGGEFEHEGKQYRLIAIGTK